MTTSRLNVTESNGELVSCPWLSLQQLNVVQVHLQHDEQVTGIP